jgi:hypothetical protein
MAKNILVVYYSQTGQLGEVLQNFLQPLKAIHILEVIRIEPKEPFGFPWDTKSFFSAMPPSVLEREIPLKDFNPKLSRYDLVVIGYQPWFLSPSIPATSFLKHPNLRKVLSKTPVITVIGARNMWLNAQEMVKRQLQESKAILVGNIALIDKSNNLASAVSIVNWLIYGNKSSLWGVFPKPGISDEDIAGMKGFGELTSGYVERGDWADYQHEVVANEGVIVRTNILFIESRAPKLFKVWAKLIDRKQNKSFWISAFKYYLFIALFLISPIVLLVYNIFVVPFTQRKIRKKKAYYLGLN